MLRGSLTILAVLLWAGPVFAETYELARVRRALEERGLQVDAAPEAKRIAWVKLVREDVFAEDEFFPTWANMFHWLTREDVIRDELLVEPGDLYVEARVEESMRNLRGLGTFTLVRIVAVRTARADEVGLLVYTRDLWSLRLETDFSGTGDSLFLTLQLAERNLFGRNKTAITRFSMNPKAFSVGEVYSDYRLLGEELSLGQSFDVIFSRDTVEPEGSAGSVSFGKPFYDLEQSFAWGTSVAYQISVARALAGSDVVQYDTGNGRVCTTAGPDCARGVWDQRGVSADLTGSYRRGRLYTQTFSTGLAFSAAEVEPNHETGLLPGQRADFERNVLPTTRRQVGPFLGYGLALPRFEVFRNLGTFGQSENVRVGPGVEASVSFPVRAFGSSTDSVRTSGGLGYTLAGGDAAARASVSAGARLEDGAVVDQGLSGGLLAVTPPWLWGRLVLRGAWSGQRRDTGRTRVVLGASNGMRGYPAAHFEVVGGNLLLGNLEYRTLPLVFESIHLGGILFYDGGSVYAKTEDIDFHHSAGFGLRLLFPQFNRTPFSFDVGFPLDEGGFNIVLSYGSSQVVPTP